MGLENWKTLHISKQHPAATPDGGIEPPFLAWAVGAAGTKLGLLLLWKPALDWKRGARAVGLCPPASLTGWTDWLLPSPVPHAPDPTSQPLTGSSEPGPRRTRQPRWLQAAHSSTATNGRPGPRGELLPGPWVLLQHFCREHLNLLLLRSLQQILVFNCGLMISPVNISFLLITKPSCLF